MQQHQLVNIGGDRHSHFLLGREYAKRASSVQIAPKLAGPEVLVQYRKTHPKIAYFLTYGDLQVPNQKQSYQLWFGFMVVALWEVVVLIQTILAINLPNKASS